MNTFQWFVLPILGILCCERLIAFARGHVVRRAAAVWALLWLAGFIAVLNPSITAMVARPLGIQRGADLVFYVAILLAFLGFFMMYARIKRLEQQLTQLVRHLAIERPRLPKDNPPLEPIAG